MQQQIVNHAESNLAAYQYSLDIETRVLFDAHLGEQLQAAREHGVDAPDAREVERGCQLLLAHAQAQQVPRRHVALQDLLEQVVQCLRSACRAGSKQAEYLLDEHTIKQT